MLTYASIRQHTHTRWLSPSPMYASIRSAYVSIRTLTYASIRQHKRARWRSPSRVIVVLLTNADIRQHTLARTHVC
jgi:hypothetical protein